MNDLFAWLNQPLSMGGGMIIAVIILNLRVKRNEKDIADIKTKCDNRLKYCLKYFQKNTQKGGE